MNISILKTHLQGLCLLFATLLASCPASGQANGDNFDLPDYESETTFGVNFNTNAGIIGGLNVRHARQVKEGIYNTFVFEMVNVKHPKEIKYSNPQTGNIFTFQKKHHLFVLRPQFGKELILFTKGPEQGIQMNAAFGVGPSLGIVKPYYILYGPSLENANIVPYKPDIHNEPSQIYGTGGFLTGFSRANIRPGIHMKASLNLEFGVYESNISGIEAGLMLEAYDREITIVTDTRNKKVYSSLFINLYFGSRDN